MAIKELEEITNIEIDPNTNSLFLERDSGDGVKVKLTDRERKFLLDEYTDESYELEEILDG